MTRKGTFPQEGTSLKQSDSETPVERDPRCPRCGYELCGVVATWSESCPVEGRCVECGLDFAWQHVLRTDRMPRWFLEFIRGWRFRGTRTLLHSLRFPHFWKAIRMSMPISGLLWTYPLRVLAILVVISVLFTLPRTIASLPTRAMPDPSANLAAIAGSLLLPFLPYAVDELIDEFSPRWSALSPSSPMRPMLVPWRWRPPADSYGNPGVRTNAHPPARIWSTVWRTVATTIAISASACAAAAATFIVLPVVRRRAKVRGVHVCRVGIYGLVVIVVLVVIEWAVEVATLLHEPSNFEWSVVTPVRSPARDWLPLLLSPLLLFWWLSACRSYLRLERPLAVAVTVTAMGTLVACLVLVKLNPRSLLMILGL